MTKRSHSCSSLAALTLLAFSVLTPCPRLAAQSQTQAPQPAQSRADEMLRMWNAIGDKLVAMAQDFPEDKYDFKVQKDQRTFAETILHVAGDNLLAISTIKGSQVGPDFHGEPPSRTAYKTKAEVVKLIKQAVLEGSAVIKTQGDAGLDRPVLSPFTADPVRVSTLWWGVIEDDGEHYGQLVVYYRANNLVPPRSR